MDRIPHTQTEGRDHKLARLLGISYEELQQLHHGGVQELTDSDMQVYKYFIQFSTDSPAHILDKLDMDAHHIVYLSAAEWEEPAT